MCCFSRPVIHVANTNIFARPSKEGRQFLVYAMTLNAREDLAMILPLPVPKGAAENAVKFISLEKYPDFFKDMESGFAPPPVESRGTKSKYDAPLKAVLEVVQVGSFEASFVPQVKDFVRLDERFRLPTEVWDKLPAYKDFGFAVFKLKKGSSTIHPMAFEFPRADPKQLFFPTVHIHDGAVHKIAEFDHLLYLQNEDGKHPTPRWRESPQPAGMFMKMEKAEGLLLKDAHCYRQSIIGNWPNEDVLV